MKGFRVYPISLGCPKNHALLELLLAALKSSISRLQVVLSPDEADYVIINSCGFISPAVVETVETLLEMKADYPSKKIILTGCVPQRYGIAEVSERLSEADFILDIRDMLGWSRIFNAEVRPVNYPFPLTFPYAYVNIGEGCSMQCSYCTIPLFKGDYVSRPIGEIVDHVRFLENSGYVEAILVSQDCASYGVDMGFRWNLPKLLSELHRATDKILFRVLYLNPRFFSPDWLPDLCRLERLVPYFDIPVQHLSDKVLMLMRRGYRFEDVVRLIDAIRLVYGDSAAVRTTIMVGFPGEDKQDFVLMLDRLSELSFDWIGVFRFYAEDGTPAASMPQLPEEEVEKRYVIASEFVRNLVEKRALRWIGERVKMVVTNVLDSGEDVRDFGYPLFCAPEIDKVIVAENGDLGDMGEVVNVEITDYAKDVFRGRVVEG